MTAAHQPTDVSVMHELLRAQTIGDTEQGEIVRASLDLSVSAPDSGAPMVLQIVPPGTQIAARDGRKFSLSKPDVAIAASEVPALIDWEHRSEFGMFGTSEAAGWIKSFRHDPALGMVADVESWTPKGAADIANRVYRFLSPVLLLNKETREVERVISVALTNTPALRLDAIDQFRTALSRGGVHFITGGEDSMPTKELCAALGLPEGADESAIKAAFAAQSERLTASEAERVTLAAKVAELETAATARDVAELEREALSLLDKAQADGRMTPAERDVWREACSTRAGFEFARKALNARTPVLDTKTTQAPPKVDSDELTEGERASMRKYGFTKAAMLAARKAG